MVVSIRIRRDIRPNHNNNNNVNQAPIQYANAAFNAVMARAFEESGSDIAWSLLNTGNWCISDVDSKALLGDFTVKLIEAKYTGSNDLETATLELSTEDSHVTAPDLDAFVKALVSSKKQDEDVKYVYDLRPGKAELNSRINQSMYSKENQDPSVLRLQRIVGAPRALSFGRHRFASTKTFENLCGPGVRELQRRVAFFLENREWYARKGVPYQLGIMLTGECGTGKSSAIRAIANATSRSIVNLNLTNVATASQLKRLLQQDSMSVFEDDEQSDPTSVRVPVSDRIYVIDEIDAVGSVVTQRSSRVPSLEALPDELTLGEILNILDGGVEIPGRIVVIISNHPERLDRALVRPGRIDVHLKFGKATSETLAELYEVFFESRLPPELVETLPEEILSPSEAAEILIGQCSKNSCTPEEVVAKLIEAAQNKSF